MNASKIKEQLESVKSGDTVKFTEIVELSHSRLHEVEKERDELILIIKTARENGAKN